MNLCLIIAAVISGCLGSVKINADVLGNLDCPEPFHYVVSLWEEDNLYNDFVTSHTDFAPTGKASYHISGPLTDEWFESDVEPYFIVEHTCVEDSQYACLCAKIPPRGVDFKEIINIDFKNTTLTKCDECAAAEKRRAKETKPYKQP